MEALWLKVFPGAVSVRFELRRKTVEVEASMKFGFRSMTVEVEASVKFGFRNVAV